ncbi:hypothetical protein DPEC_G00210700 [Dallia pectoralis]|uniref:Uncharacterized protein n=1 Tax=Dallia pectoralis TaxID=75939 RepID=A0ACC2G603_DALPE|nr:hypothetical protein DPEC_G00210700 [Dallia pectoralis]
MIKRKRRERNRHGPSRHTTHTLKRFAGPYGAAREWPSVSCVCAEGRRGAPLRLLKKRGQSGRRTAGRERRGARQKGQALARREKSSHKAVLQRERGGLGTMPL